MGSRLLNLGNGKKEGMSFPMNSQELQKIKQTNKNLDLDGKDTKIQST